MKRITKADLQNLYEPVPDGFRDEMRFVLASLEERKERRIMKKKMVLVLAAAMVLLIAGAVAIAAVNLDIFRYNEDVSQPIVPMEGAEELVETELGSAENELVTATVKEAIFDGQGTRILVEITPKNPDEYVLFHALFQDAPDDLYEKHNVPAKVEYGEQEMVLGDKTFRIVNVENWREVYVNGEKADIPGDAETAIEKGIPVYKENGKLYYAEQFDFVVDGRKDGKKMISYWAEANVGNYDGSHLDGMYIDVEEQPDGSILYWLDGFYENGTSDKANVTVHVQVSVDEATVYPLDDIKFTLDKNTIEKNVSLVPQSQIPGIEITSATISFTEFQGYMFVDFTVADKEDTWFKVCDMDGNEIASGGGRTQDWRGGKYRQSFSIQSFDEIPEQVKLVAYRVGAYEEVGSCVCDVVTE